MRRSVPSALAGAIAAAIILLPALARADAALCREFRDNIIRMEAPQSVRPPGWFNLDTYLRLLYKADCIDHPTAAPEAEYWYDIHGNSTGVPVAPDVPRPADGAYATTSEIGAACAGEKPGNPSMCALLKGVEKSCGNPVDEHARRTCKMLLGDTATGNTVRPPPGEDLPPIAVSLPGGPFQLDAACLGVLSSFGNDLALDDSGVSNRAGWLATMQSHCPDFLDALQRRTGLSATRDPAHFWPEFGQLLLSGFAPPGADTRTIGDVSADPGFRRMCRDADSKMKTCELRQSNMRSADYNGPVGTTSQAGAFNECRILYGQVLAMCSSTQLAAQRLASQLPPVSPQASANPPRSASPGAGGQSRPPPGTASGPSPRCQKLVQNYIAAAQANDGPNAMAGYAALKQAGGCGVLDKVDRPASPASDPRFIARSATPMIDQTVSRCDEAPDECAAIVRQLQAGTSPEAAAAVISNAIGIGLQLGAMMGSAALSSVPTPIGPSGRTTDMSSIGNRAVRSTYGQGSPLRPAPQGRPSDITGTTGH